MSFNHTIAAIDIGTNSFHMVVASIDSKGMLNILSRDKEYVRLGASANDMKEITPEAMEKAIDTLKAFAKIAQNHNAEIKAIATSATREAENKNILIERAKKEAGVEIEVISGQEEGRLIYLGAIHSLPINGKLPLLIDIGGGSTETVVGNGLNIKYCKSVKLGTVRLMKKFFDKPLITISDINKCIKYITGEWALVIENLQKFEYDMVICTSGTLENLLSMSYLREYGTITENQNGIKITSENLLKVIDKIKRAKTSEKIAQIEGIDPKRADIILGGALITEYFIKSLGIKELTYSSYALREGILYDYLGQKELIDKNKTLTSLRFNSIKNLMSKYNIDEQHSIHIRDLSFKLFDETQKLHNLGDHEREILEVACYLHDSGFFISHDSHHKHSYYLIKNSEMPGFTNDESELIANIARYHRKSLPKKNHSSFQQLRENYKKIVWVLGGILRLTEGLDRRQKGFVSDIDVIIYRNQITVVAHHKENINPDIEIWGAERRKDMLEISLGKKIFLKSV